MDKFWRVLKQVGREFWFPFLAAAVWTFFRVSHSQPDFTASLIANFSTSFFLAGWATGQLLRIARQLDVEDWFGELARQFDALNDTLAPVVRYAKTMLEGPRLEPEERTAAESLVQTAARIAAATKSFSEASRQKQPWYLDQSMTPLPLRKPNPAIYTQGPAEPPWPPPSDKPEATSRS